MGKKLQRDGAKPEDAIVALLTKRLPVVRAIYLFGSQARGEPGADSDFDIALLTPAPLPVRQRFELAEALTLQLGGDVDLVDLYTAPTVLRSQIVGNGRVLFAAPDFDTGAFEDFVFSDYARLNEERAGILSDIRERGSVYG